MAASGSSRPTLPRPNPVSGANPVEPLDPFGAFVSLKLPTSHSVGPLSDLTLAVKDLLVFGDRVPLCGLSAAPFDDLGPSSPVVAKLVTAGAELSGFTTLSALAYEPSGINADGTRPRNPWNSDYICGGSSSGSAVAVAAGLADLAVGSDTGGSLRIPAQCSGVAAWKPGFGLLPLTGVMPLAPSLDCLGFMARDIGVLERAAALFAGDCPDFTTVTVARDLMEQCDAEIAAMFAAQIFAVASLGLQMRDGAVKTLLADADGPVFDLMQGEAYRSFLPLFDSKLLSADLARRLQKGQTVTDGALSAARASLADVHAQWCGRLFANGSCLLLPVMPVTTPTVNACTQGHADFAPRHLYALSEFTRFVNGLGLPAVAVPMALDKRGLPMAMQLVGPKGSDRALLSLAKRLEATRGDFASPCSTPTDPAGKIAS